MYDRILKLINEVQLKKIKEALEEGKTARTVELSEEEKELEQEIQELKQANARIANEIRAAEKKYAEQLAALKNNSSSGGSTTPTGSGYLMRPVKGGSISANGYYSSGRFHGAIDYAVSSGTPVYAAADGVVMLTANLTTSYGTHVVIRHANGMQTYYAHGTYGTICVSAGQTVKKGQVEIQEILKDHICILKLECHHTAIMDMLQDMDKIQE